MYRVQGVTGARHNRNTYLSSTSSNNNRCSNSNPSSNGSQSCNGSNNSYSSKQELIFLKGKYIGITVEIPAFITYTNPNNHILTQSLCYNYYYPNPKYLIIGDMDPEP